MKKLSEIGQKIFNYLTGNKAVISGLKWKISALEALIDAKRRGFFEREAIHQADLKKKDLALKRLAGKAGGLKCKMNRMEEEISDREALRKQNLELKLLVDAQKPNSVTITRLLTGEAG